MKAEKAFPNKEEIEGAGKMRKNMKGGVSDEMQWERLKTVEPVLVDEAADTRRE